MAEQTQKPALNDPEEAFQRMVLLLQAKDDTSRFVGLALLKSVLDNQIQLRDETERIRTLWQSLSPKFLDRLLRAGQNPKLSPKESRDMVDLAVGVLHTFTVLLPTENRTEKRLIGRTGYLINALVHSSPETTKLILQSLLTFVSQLEGALELLNIKDLSPLIEIAPQQSIALDILFYAWSNASADSTESQNIIQQVDDVVLKLLLSFESTDGVTLLHFMGNIIPKLTFEISQEPKWLLPLTQILRKLVTSRPTLAGRSAYTMLAAALLQVFPEKCPHLLFKDNITTTAETKPFSYLFINLLLIDIRSSFPSLLSQINTPEYSSISQRLSSAFDITSAFIGYLVKSLDLDESDTRTENILTMSPDLLLKLRKDIAETMSLTIEYLRDRYDASIAGAPGLDPSARGGTSVTSSGSHLTLTWDSLQQDNNVTQDSLILAGLRTLAIWLREDENENLRNESAALMDLFMDLYKTSLIDKSVGNLDFRYPILTALEGILVTEDGLQAFLAQNGWPVLSSDLTTLLHHKSPLNISEAILGIEIIRTLLLILDHPSTTTLEESWMSILTPISSISLTSNLPPSTPNILSLPIHPKITEFQIAALQLATALFMNAPKGMIKRYRASLSAVLGIAGQLLKGGGLEGELRDEVEDVVLGLEGCR